MKDYSLAVGRVFLLAALLPTPVASQGDSATVQVVRVIDGDTIEVCCGFEDRVRVSYVCVLGGRDVCECMAGGEWFRTSDDRTA